MPSSRCRTFRVLVSLRIDTTADVVCRSLHVSEDVFGGYNVMLRGRDVTYVDYIAVGKGRDMGFETINTFEAKVCII